MECFKFVINEYKESNDIQNFIDVHWAPSHVLAKNKLLFDWQYLDQNTSTYNFSLVLNPICGQLLGILGFIPTYHFDTDLREERDFWGSIWKVSSDVKQFISKDGEYMGLGTALLDFLITTKKLRSFGAIGINKRVARLYKHLGFFVGTLNHFYMVNQEKKQFNILDCYNGIFNEANTIKKECKVSIIKTKEELSINWDKKILPLKSASYFINRYIKHPFYSYTIIRITNKNCETCILVYRIVKANQSHAVRIVDFAGNPAALIGASYVFQEILRKHDAEYLDFYNYGLPENVLTDAGFLLRTLDSSVIVPNYFEPFERRNINMMFAYKIFSEQPYTYMICKGDADQDRPNFLEQGVN